MHSIAGFAVAGATALLLVPLAAVIGWLAVPIALAVLAGGLALRRGRSRFVRSFAAGLLATAAIVGAVGVLLDLSYATDARTSVKPPHYVPCSAGSRCGPAAGPP